MLNWKLLSLLSLPLWYGVEFCWSLTQLHSIHNNQGDCNLGSYAARCGCWNFLTANTACEAWGRIIPAATLSVQGHITFSRHFILASVLSVRPYGKINGVIASTSLVTTPNTMMRTGCFVLINMSMCLSLHWHLDTVKSSCWNFLVNTKKYNMLFPNFLGNE